MHTCGQRQAARNAAPLPSLLHHTPISAVAMAHCSLARLLLPIQPTRTTTQLSSSAPAQVVKLYPTCQALRSAKQGTCKAAQLLLKAGTCLANNLLPHTAQKWTSRQRKSAVAEHNSHPHARSGELPTWWQHSSNTYNTPVVRSSRD